MGTISTRREYLLLGAVILLALFMRLYGINFGLPLHYHIDETRVMQKVMRIVHTGDLNPRFFHYPSFMIYSLSALTLLYYGIHFIPFAIESVIGWKLPTLSAFKLAFDADASALYLLSRVSLATFGILTVVIVYLLVKRLFSRQAAFYAALFISIVPLHVIESHYIKQEVFMTFFMILALYIGVRGVNSSSRAVPYLVGLTAGIAGSVKYNGIYAVSIFPMLSRREGKLDFHSFFGKNAVKVLLVAVLTFLATSPYVLLDFERFIIDFTYEMYHVSKWGHHAFDLDGSGLIYHRFLYQILAAFPFSLGIPVYALSILGIVYAVLRVERSFLWILFFTLPYFITTALMKVVFLRYYMPIIVVLCISAGYAVSIIISRDGIQGRVARLAVWGIVLYTAFFTWSLERNMPRGSSTLDDGLRWIQGNVEEGSKIAYTHFTPPLTRSRYELVHLKSKEFTREWLEKESPDVILVSGLVAAGFYRGSEETEEGRRLLDDLRSNRVHYERVAYYQRNFLHKEFFASIDPTLAETFMPGIEIFVREDAP